MSDQSRKYALVRVTHLSLESFARETGLHPHIVVKLVALGLIDAQQDPRGELRFPTTQVAVVAKIQRLRRGLGLNYAGVGAVLALLDRVAELEAQAREPR